MAVVVAAAAPAVELPVEELVAAVAAGVVVAGAQLPVFVMAR